MKESSCSCMSRTSYSNNNNQCDTLIALLTWKYLGEDGEATANRSVIHNLTYYCLSFLCLRYKLCLSWFTLIVFDINCTYVSILFFAVLSVICASKNQIESQRVSGTPLFCFVFFAMITIAVTMAKLFIFLVFFQLHPSCRVILKERKVPAKQRAQREENERIQARKKRIKKEIGKRKEKKKEALIN